jgi:hypothetical protein
MPRDINPPPPHFDNGGRILSLRLRLRNDQRRDVGGRNGRQSDRARAPRVGEGGPPSDGGFNFGEDLLSKRGGQECCNRIQKKEGWGYLAALRDDGGAKGCEGPLGVDGVALARGSGWA